MLVLARHVDERILIGDKIEICVVRVIRDRVHLGIVAPNDMPIVRKELLGRKAAPARPAPIVAVSQ